MKQAGADDSLRNAVDSMVAKCERARQDIINAETVLLGHTAKVLRDQGYSGRSIAKLFGVSRNRFDQRFDEAPLFSELSPTARTWVEQRWAELQAEASPWIEQPSTRSMELMEAYLIEPVDPQLPIERCDSDGVCWIRDAGTAAERAIVLYTPYRHDGCMRDGRGQYFIRAVGAGVPAREYHWRDLRSEFGVAGLVSFFGTKWDEPERERNAYSAFEELRRAVRRTLGAIPPLRQTL